MRTAHTRNGKAHGGEETEESISYSGWEYVSHEHQACWPNIIWSNDNRRIGKRNTHVLCLGTRELLGTKNKALFTSTRKSIEAIEACSTVILLA